MRISKFSLITTTLLCAGVALAETPILRSGFAGYTLSIPYLPYGSGANKGAVSLNMNSRDMLTYTLNMASITPVPVQAPSSDDPILSITGTGVRISMPYLQYAVGSSLTPLTAAIESRDLTTFVVDMDSVRLLKAVAGALQ